MGSEFVTPPPQAFVNALGIEPATEGDYGYTLHLSDITDQELTFSYNSITGSVALYSTPSTGGLPLKIHREGATLLWLDEEAQKTRIVVEFRTEDTVGRMILQVFPSLDFSEETLIT
ncbi:hypothetical protein ACGFXC_35415 [Streptomyces sp. NPDC048507]|uniref:hypothetical protein n=1 Tax=Streptomyces sp. NPDC048507 TaxID=3365560 RepID=UPI0037163099